MHMVNIARKIKLAPYTRGRPDDDASASRTRQQEPPFLPGMPEARFSRMNRSHIV